MPFHEQKKPVTGTYVLVIWFRKTKEISVGRLGTYPFPRGYYLYVGSAFGPGGLGTRIRRHLHRIKKHHWHIDYLVSEETIIDVLFSSDKDKHECGWVNTLKGVPELQRPIPGFGSSDCSCRSHLFYSKKKPMFTYYRDLLGARLQRWDITEEGFQIKKRTKGSGVEGIQ